MWKASAFVIAALAAAVAGKLGGQTGVSPRLYLKKLVQDVLDRVELHPTFDPRRDYALTVSEADLTAQERAAAGRRQIMAGQDDPDAVDLDLS